MGAEAETGPTRDLLCHDCDLVHAHVELERGEKAVCTRCGSLLARGVHEVAARTFSFALASLVLLIVANVFPFMEFKIAGRVQVARITTGVTQLWKDGYPELSCMVAFTSVVAPLVMLVGLLMASGPMLVGHRHPWMRSVGKVIGRLKAWSMMEVFLLGVIVSAIKLSQMADIVFGPALFAFLVLIVTSTAAVAVYDPPTFWDYLDGRDAA